MLSGSRQPITKEVMLPLIANDKSIHAYCGESPSPVENTCVAATQLPIRTASARPGDDAENVVASDLTKVDDRNLDELIAGKAVDICLHQRKAGGHREAEKACWRDVIPLLDEMRKRLTLRGKKSERNYTTFLRAKGLNPSTVRSWRRRLQLEIDSAADGPVGSKEESPGAPDNYAGKDEREEIQTGPELIAKFISQMRRVLTGKTIMSDSGRIRRAAEMLHDLERANNEGKLFPMEGAGCRRQQTEKPDQPTPAVTQRTTLPVKRKPKNAQAAAVHQLHAEEQKSPATTTPEDVSARAAKKMPIPAPNLTTHCPRNDVPVPTALPKADAPRLTKAVPSSGPGLNSAEPKITLCPAAYEVQGEGRADRIVPDAGDYIPRAILQAGYALNDENKLEFVGKQ